MSKTLTRLRNLVTELDTIQMNGRKCNAIDPFLEPFQARSTSEVAETAENVVPLSKITPQTTAAAGAVAEEGKVFIQFKGNIAVQLQLENSDEIVELKQRGESIEILFNDGKAIHLPIKGVA